jgi:hypothetical protein
MRIRLFLLGFTLLLALPVSARQNTDVIIMKNGDRLTGEIKGLKGDVLEVSLPYVDGNLSVQWSKVERLESNQLFLVQTKDGAIHTGTLDTLGSSAGGPLTIQIWTDSLKMAVEKAEVVRVEETASRFYRRLSGDLNLGANYSKGNNSTQYNFGSSLEYLRQRWGLEASFDSSLSASSGADVSTRNQLRLKEWTRVRRTNWYYSGFGGLLHSAVQGIDLQTTFGGGIGRFFKNTNRTRLSVLGGIAWSSTAYHAGSVPVERQEVYGGVIASELKVFFFKRTNLSLNASLVPAISDPGRVRFDTDASYYLKLFKNLNWNLSFYGNWDTRPPGNFSGSDYGYSLGLKWTFGFR